MAAQRTFRVFSDIQNFEIRIPRIVHQETPYQRLPLSKDQLDRLCRLKQSDLPGHNSQDAGFVSAGDKAWRRRIRKKAAQARSSSFGEEDACLALKLEDPTVNIWLPSQIACIVYEVLCWKIV